MVVWKDIIGFIVGIVFESSYSVDGDDVKNEECLVVSGNEI